MKTTTFLCTILFVLFFGACIAQPVSHKLSLKIEIDETLKENFEKDGRLYIFLSKNMRSEPRTQTWPSPVQKTFIFAQNIADANADEGFLVDNSDEWITTISWNLDEVPQGEYNFQVL